MGGRASRNEQEAGRAGELVTRQDRAIRSRGSGRSDRRKCWRTWDEARPDDFSEDEVRPDGDGRPDGGERRVRPELAGSEEEAAAATGRGGRRPGQAAAARRGEEQNLLL
jgi:hypothetical protein